jgi:S-DNA-T family DNA segregation ATPase FtsK/SpoIIIE
MIKTRSSDEIRSAARRKTDMAGLLFFFLGVISLLALTWPQGGIIPPFLDHSLRLIAGAGAYILPIIFMYIGTMFLIGYERLAFTHSTAGTALFFIAFVTWRHLESPLALHDTSWSGGSFLPAGGYLGAVFGNIFNQLFGKITSDIILLMMACISVMLLADRPFIEIMALLRRPADAGLSVARKSIEAVKSSRPVTAKENKTSRRITGEETAPSLPAPPAPRTKKPGFLNVLMPRNVRDDGSQLILPLDDENPPDAKDKKPDQNTTPQDNSNSHAPTLLSETHKEPGAFQLPPTSLLKESPAPAKRTKQELDEKIKVLEQTLDQFGIGANVIEVAAGPTVTRYEIELAPGIKVSKIVSLADNLAMALAAIHVRVEAPIPGKSAIGVEVPNSAPSIVSLRECIENPEFQKAGKLTIALGKDVAGKFKYTDLTRMPHLLIGGSTNSGKSVCLNALIASLLYRLKPEEVQFLMIDPKRVELSLWDGIPHLMHPVVKDVKQASGIFRAALKEMDKRYDLFARMGTRNIDGYNQKVDAEDKLPYIIVVVDELADLMMQAAAEIETSICRLAQLARATGIHLVIATQRPSVDVITGLIKANISSRIAFAVSSQVDSRTILDQSGAERLIGRGDMLFMPIDAMKPIRMQGCYLSEQETNELVKYLKEQQKPTYTLTPMEASSTGTGLAGSRDEDGEDEYFESAVKLVVQNGQASTSMLQRRFKIGYTRAARLVDMMQDRGIVGPPDGAKPREILITRDDAEQMFREAFRNEPF